MNWDNARFISVVNTFLGIIHVRKLVVVYLYRKAKRLINAEYISNDSDRE